ncbi:hypothetical protein KAFR_0A00550 [Kazachstania africana CBS 2517]|uniref:Transcription activator GCR1-like domain-containing protein n=1 Tax=Kazachstania africana (strain ATCC 22294 / BCRC 22015 / CBS 2517 / CECT 1963 / NBRC 1671 / NRRL Y-8276) TaxID=1071382 RepID=H2AM93_KAZAF|nr:hypothetical protein KAFR_0A00550 [Kazachstania africana CBS 2517]CCF55493.1 hypothetical protein KAFR_0A00550 [Kazachstania africana CBS 2517]
MFESPSDDSSRTSSLRPESPHDPIRNSSRPDNRRKARPRSNYQSPQEGQNDSNEMPFQSFIIDQLTRLQEQNEMLKNKVEAIQREQEEYYISQVKTFDNGFKNVDTCIKDVANLKELFKEMVGIMTGDRVRFLDHTNESVTSAEAERLNKSSVLNTENALVSTPTETEGWMAYRRDDNVLTHNERVRVKLETDGRLPEGPPNSYPFPTRRDEDALSYINSIVDAQERGDRSTENALRVEQAMNYKINRAIQSVSDVAREYFEGFHGKPSLLSLERRFGSTWRRAPGDRTLFAKRKCIISKIDQILENPTNFRLPQDLTRNQAIKVIENIRLGNNTFRGYHCRLTLAQLYEYFSKKMDKKEDYSLKLINKGVPRRTILSRQREAELKAKEGVEGLSTPTDTTPVQEDDINNDNSDEGGQSDEDECSDDEADEHGEHDEQDQTNNDPTVYHLDGVNNRRDYDAGNNFREDVNHGTMSEPMRLYYRNDD